MRISARVALVIGLIACGLWWASNTTSTREAPPVERNTRPEERARSGPDAPKSSPLLHARAPAPTPAAQAPTPEGEANAIHSSKAAACILEFVALARIMRD